MSSTSERPPTEQTRTYDRASSVVFLKTDAPFGGLSNMAGGFPLHVQGTRIYTSEALYQACRFPHLPEVQRLIIGQASPMTAKMKSKPHRNYSRPDWDRVRVKVMRWCLRVKLAQNWAKFSEVLLRTDDRPIVEESRRDAFWGAKPVDEQTLVGMNVLGRLLMELREAVKLQGPVGFQAVQPLDIPDFLFLGRPIGTVGAHELGARHVASTSPARAEDGGVFNEAPEQSSLFDTPGAREAPAPAYITSPTPDSTRPSELKPYPAMKDSGVAWLGELPAHWAVRRLKYLLRERDLRSSTGTEQLLRVSQFTGVTERRRADGGEEPDTRAESLAGYKLVEPEDLVVNIMLAWNGSMGVSRFSGIASPAYCVYRFSASAQPWYFHHLLRSPAYKARIKAVSTGVVESRLRLYSDDLYRLEGLLPPVTEQAAIVRFLDHADRRIRRYIRAKQKLIKLLEEQKQAIIHRAVTRGLDPNARLKPSGVEWLGDVPEHWELFRVKQVARVLRGKFTHRPRNDPSLYDGQYPFIQTGEVARAGKSITGFRQTLNERGLAVSKLFPAGTLVMTIAANIGDVAILDFEACFPDSVVGFVPSARVERDFLYYMFVAMRPELLQEAPVNTQGNLNVDRIGARAFAVPPLPEQWAIVRAIESDCASLTEAIGKAQRDISLLREYRTRLIADVVTGKLDVREAAARLPEETEEPEPLDETGVAADTEESDVGNGDALAEEAEA
jgi:type I restriction enzyme S subunit